MRISDLSTFDSKPILWSQLDELLSNKNVTMLGNQANIPSGLVVLDDKGKIPENANIQHIFYVDNDFPISGLIKNSLYVNSAGEARATDDNAEYINISLQVVTDFSTVSDETVATTKAIKDYVDTAVTEVATGSSGVLSSYATKEYVDNAVASASGEQHIFYVDALPSIEDAIENSLYVVKGTKEAQIFDGTEYAPISLEALTDFSTVSNDTLATTQAISAFVDEKISNIDIPDPDLSAYQPVSGMSDYALKTDIPDVPEEVIYVDEFPASGLLDTIYVNKNGQSKIWNGTEFVSMSYEVVDSISTETSQSGVVVPSVQAVIDYVSAYTPTLPDNITTQGNEFNSGNQLVQLVDGKIPESLYNGDTQHIFYVDEFPVSGVENSLYVKQDTKETKIYTGSEYVSISLEVIKDLTAATSGTIATSKSIVDYLSAYYADKAYVTDAVTSAMLSGEVDLTPYAKTEWVNTELAKKANLTDIKDHIIKVESLPEISAALANSIYILGNSSASFFDGTEFIPLSLEAVTDFSNTNHSTIPTTQAVSSFVDTKISEINIPSTDLSYYYNKTESDEKFALKDDINSKLALSVVEDFPSSGINNTLYVNNENHAQIYANDQWKDIAVEVVENFETVNQTTVPTTQAVKDYIDANAGSGGISSITVGSGLTGNGTSESPLKLDLSNYSQDGNISITAEELDLEAGINFNVTAENINLNSHAKNTAGGFAIVEDSGKLPTSIIPESTVDLSNYHGGFKVITDEAEGPILIQGSPITLLGYELTLQSTLGNMILNAAGNNIDIDARVCDIYGTYIKLSTSQNSLTFNGAELNTPGGLVRLDENGKINATLVTDTFNNPEQKTEVTANSIAFKKNISIYKIEVANATTFTFDFSQLDENNCYTFELWVSMPTPVTLTFPSDVAWLNDEVPDMSEASTYCIVVRKLPSTMGTSTITSPKALLNLAYQYQLVLG